MEEKTDIKAKTIKVDTGKGNTIKWSYVKI